MPFCEDCAKYWAPSAMAEDGTCPTCGRTLEAPAVQPPSGKGISGKDLRELAGEDAKAPWHFKVLVALVILYLGYRVVDLFM